MSQPVTIATGDTFDIKNVEVGLQGTLQPTSSIETAANIVNVLLGLAGIVAVFASLVVWLVALISVLRRDDLKEHKLLWVALLLFIGPVGVIAYAFVENRKKLGYYAIASYAALPVILILFAIFSFVLGSLA